MSELSELEKLQDQIDELEFNLEGYRDWFNLLRENAAELDSPPRNYHGCICSYNKEDRKWDIDVKCEYHATAAKYPSNHSIPWNCPTYYDGCNCKEYFLKDKR